jgi:pimeloyl-ACP methyl ester carboxylesterase
MASRNKRAGAVRAAVLLMLAGLLGVSAIVLCENGVHIPTNLRAPAPERLAQDLSAATGAHWQQTEIPAEDGTVLSAWLFRPAHPNGGRAVILLHGIADTRKGVLAQAAILLRQDYLVLAPDLRGHGVSGGSYISYGVKEAFDVHSWANWLFQTQQVTALYGLGESLGGAVLLQSVLREPRFRAIIAEDSFSTFPAVAYYRVARTCGIPVGLARWSSGRRWTRRSSMHD